MNKRILLSALVGSVANFILGALIYGLAGMDAFMKSHMTHYEGLEKAMDAMVMVYIFLSGYGFAWLFAYIFDSWAHLTDFMGGAKAGAMISVIVSLSFDLYFLGAMNLFSPTAVVADVCISAVIGAVTAGVVAWTQGKLGAKAA